MSSIGTGYDLSVTTFSLDGRVFQIEYAAKAVDNSGSFPSPTSYSSVWMYPKNHIRCECFGGLQGNWEEKSCGVPFFSLVNNDLDRER